jgi:magnesium-transporting ATPase (P-type)
MWFYWINIFDAVWQSTVIFFIAYFAYANNAEVDALSFGFSLIFSMMVTSLIHVVLQTTRVEIALISSIVLSFLIFFVFTLIFDTTCVACLNGQSPYQVSYSMFRQGIFWLTNLFTIITAMLPRFLVKCVYNSTVNPLLRNDQENITPSSTQNTYL